MFVLTTTVCDDLSAPSNGAVTVNGHRTNDTAVYSCDDGFELVGDDVRTCLSNSDWSGETPVCLSIHGNDLVIVSRNQIRYTISSKGLMGEQK